MATALRQRLLAAIHMQSKQLALDDDVRRALQERVAGKRSCADMSIGELRAVSRELRQAMRMVGPFDPAKPAESAARMRAKARQLAADMGAREAYLDAIAMRQAGVKLVDATAEQLRGVIAALWRQGKRRRSRELG